VGVKRLGKSLHESRMVARPVPPRGFWVEPA
jgi:hypothetical protein